MPKNCAKAIAAFSRTTQDWYRGAVAADRVRAGLDLPDPTRSSMRIADGI